MKHISLRLFIILLITITGNVNAFSFEVDGISYSIISEESNEVEVSSYSDNYIGNVVIPDSILYEGHTYYVTAIGNSAFHGCSQLTSITIPNSVSSIRNSAFRGCESLTSMIIPDSVTAIEDCVFYDCTSLSSIVLPNNLIRIGGCAFLNCSSLASIELPNGITHIEEFAFEGCSSLRSIIVPNSMFYISNSSFADCINLTSVTIHSNKVKDWFGYNKFIQEIILGDSVTVIDDFAFYECSALNSVSIGKNVTSIGWNAFGNCSRLTSISIPESVTDVRWRAFANCSNLTSISILSEDIFIEEYAFSQCIAMNDFYCYSENMPHTQERTFSEAPIDSATLHVPSSSIEQYKSKDPWSGFGSIVALDSSGIDDVSENAVQIRNVEGQLIVSGIENDTEVTVYSLDGSPEGHAFSKKGTTTIKTNIKPGNAAIVKVGQKAMKVIVK